MDRITKSFPVFDCDAHVNDPLEIWDYVPKRDRELVRATYWRTEGEAWLNGIPVVGGGTKTFDRRYNPVTIAGPQMNVQIMARINAMGPLTEEQIDYLEHRGAYDPKARVRDLDLMGIDQVLVIPTTILGHLPYVESPEGAVAFCRAYNDWVADWCAEVPDRLFGAALLPLQDPLAAAREVERVAARGLPVALVRPIDARGGYPNQIGPYLLAQVAMTSPKYAEALDKTLDVVFRAIEDTGVCLGMHTFPEFRSGRTRAPGLMSSVGEFMAPSVDPQAYCFIYEAQTWLAQVLLSGFLDRYPRLRMLVFESNATWLPSMLDHCDRLFTLYRNEREVPADRPPSQAFAEQCGISFESDETTMFRLWRQFEDLGIWASDCYHHDGADAWSAIRRLRDAGVPEDVQAKLLGGNARRFYGIEGKVFVTDEPPPIERPPWFPQGGEFEEWVELVSRPRRNIEALRAHGWDRTIIDATVT